MPPTSRRKAASATKAYFRERLKELVEKFHRHRDSYLDPNYLEAQVRVDFIDPLIEALGWDVRNTRGLDSTLRDVIVERGDTVGKPDYNFRLAGRTQFFAEAKAPHVSVARSDVVLQAKKYAWGNLPDRVPFAVATNFEEFRLYDTTSKPRPRHPNSGLVFALRYDRFLEPKSIDQLWMVSHSAVSSGVLNKLALRSPEYRSRVPLDKQFLDDLTSWRTLLAKNANRVDPRLDETALGEAVQTFLDRLIFIRVAEDRGALESGRLRQAVEAWRRDENAAPLVPSLLKLFQSVNVDLIGEIFKPSIADRIDWEPNLVADIIDGDDGLEPYDFTKLGVEILGSVYERYLGKTIRVTPQHVKVEDKPAVRKAGGVYYTPRRVVDYIIQSTLGPVIEGKSPDQITKIRVLDPACGSGSFLISAYQFLMDYHLRWYAANRASHAQQTVLFEHGDRRLSLKEKARILRNNIFGVDIDRQAVQVSMMSLYVKMLENERSLPHKKSLLPALSPNIRCGNSLIEPDYYRTEGAGASEEERARINAFPWKAEFPEIMDRSGFQVVLGNPPWGGDLSEPELAYLRRKHARVIARMADTFIYFIDRSTQLCPKGVIGMVVPATMINQVDSAPVRRVLLDRGVTKLVNLGQDVFGSEALNTSMVFVSDSAGKSKPPIVQDLSKKPIEERLSGLGQGEQRAPAGWKNLVSRDPHFTFVLSDVGSAAVLDRLRQRFEPLSGILTGEIQRGVTPDVVGAHVLPRSEARTDRLEPELLRRSVSGRLIKRYQPWKSDKFIIYATRDVDIRRFPRTLARLERFRSEVTCPEVRDGKHPWWALHRGRSPEIFTVPKLIGLTTSKTIELIYDESGGLFVTDAMYVFSPAAGVDPLALMALMQSRPFLFLYRVANQGEARVIPQVKASKLGTLPVPKLRKGSALVEDLKKACSLMLELHKRLHAQPHNTTVARQVAALDCEIDAIAEKAYGLSAAEKNLVGQTLGYGT